MTDKITFSEAKNKSAIEYGFNDFNETYITKRKDWSIGDIYERAAELYASSERKRVWEEACEAQKVICAQKAETENCYLPSTYEVQTLINHSSILRAPNAEFKP